MSDFQVDYQKLENKLSQKKFYRLADVQDRLVKIAWDIVRFPEGDNIDGLWQIQSCDDGEFIVAMYDENAPVAKTSSDWNVITDRTGNYLNVFYKGEPVTRFSAASFGIPAEESHKVCEYLPTKLASNPQLVRALLQDLPASERQVLLDNHPELNK